MLVMQEEIFGPVIPIRTYANYRDAVAYVSAKPRPLGLYYFGNDPDEQRYTLDHTISGGVTIINVLLNVAGMSLPFSAKTQKTIRQMLKT